MYSCLENLKFLLWILPAIGGRRFFKRLPNPMRGELKSFQEFITYEKHFGLRDSLLFNVVKI